MIELEKYDARTVHKAIEDFFREFDIPLKNLIGFASDNASVMMGKKVAYERFFKKKIPIYTSFIRHLHLASSAAARTLPHKLEVLSRNLYSYFAHSSKRLVRVSTVAGAIQRKNS